MSESHTLLLTASPGVRIFFRSNTGHVGTIAEALTFRAWDATSGNSGAYDTISATGLTTAFSAATDTDSLSVAADATSASTIYFRNGTVALTVQVSRVSVLSNSPEPDCGTTRLQQA